MKVFLSVASFKPSYGGPARSVSRLADALAEKGLEVGAWAPDQSAMDTGFIRQEGGVRRLGGDASEALRQFGGADLIHDNGLWLRHNHELAVLAQRRGIVRVVSPRGMLLPWAVRHKRWKKWLAWRLYQKADFAGAAGWHATAASEVAQLGFAGNFAQGQVIPNGVDVPAEAEPWPEGDGPRVMLFVGRIYPVKGLPLLVEAWAKVRPSGWVLRIVGPDEAGHQAEVAEQVRRAGLDGVVAFKGALAGAQLRQAYAEAEVVVLPSHTENFGMVVAEALAQGRPVIASRGTPWQGLVQRECGWWPEVSAEGVAGAREAAAALSSEARRAMGARGRDWMEADFSWSGCARAMARWYGSLVPRA